MAIVIYVGFGFAALRNANDLWATSAYTLAILAVSAAVVGAVARKGRARMTWLGFAVFGGASLLIWLSTCETIDHSWNGPPAPVMTWGLRSLELHINQNIPVGHENSMNFIQVCHSLEVILFGLVGAAMGRLVAAKDDQLNA
jgi:MFS family permease